MKIPWLNLLGHHGPGVGLDLEAPECVACRDEVPHVSVIVFFLPRVQIDLCAVALLDEVDALLKGVEVTERQEVELDQTDLGQCYHVELSHELPARHAER